MMDASGVTLSADDLRPLGRCSRCERIMVRYSAFPDGLPAGVVRHGARGLCNPCHVYTWRQERRSKPVSAPVERLMAAVAAADSIDLPDTFAFPSRVEPFLGMPSRGEPRSEDANRAARDAYIAARRRRLARSQGRALRSALSSGWDAL